MLVTFPEVRPITGSANVDNAVVSQSVYLTVNVLAKGTTAP